MMTNNDWTGCYSAGWGDIIVPDAYAHPAKYSRALIQRIYQHARDEGWLTTGSTVVDPFGGVALGGFDAAWNGCQWVGVELEPKFVALGNQNITRWEERYGHMPGWGSVRLVQGDSRRLGEVVREAGLCVSSPPYSDFGRQQGTDNKQSEFFPNQKQGERANCWRDGYGSTPGQLGSLPATERGFDAAIGSPPFAKSLASDDPEKRGGLYRDPKRKNDKTLTAMYGNSDGQLGAMRDRAGGFDQCVSSPPYEGQQVGSGGDGRTGWRGYTDHGGGTRADEAQLSAKAPDDFWTAAREIVAQTYSVLRPGAHACWVVKSFVRNKRVVDFPDQWRQLCESVGFRTLHLHRAWLVEVNGHQGRLDGGEADRVGVERKSFFRRLAESKGSPRIDYEVVLCMEVPNV